MSILFISPYLPYPPHRDGTSLILFHLIKNLFQKVEISLLTFKLHTKEEEKALLNRFPVKLETIPYLPQYPNLASYYLSRNHWPWLTTKFYSKKFVQKIKEVDQNKKFDLIYLHSAFLAHYIPKIKKTPLVFNSIDSLSSWFTQLKGKEKNPIKRFHFSQEKKKSLWMEKNIYPKTDLCLVVSETDKKNILKQNRKIKIEAIPNGIDLKYFKLDPKIKEIPFSLIFTGIMDYPPNVDAVLWFYQSVWLKLREKYPKIVWFVVGKNPHPKIKALAKDPQIKVTGFVKDIRDYLARAQVYICPLHIATGIQNKILEAMAMDKAIVATKRSFEGIPAKDKNYLEANTSSEFIKSVDLLFRYPEKRKELSQSAHQYAQGWGWSTTAEIYLKVFNSILTQ